jgi:type IV pilus assembly protein PilA
MKRLRTARREQDDRGFTLIEILIVLLIMGVVLAIAGSVLFSMSQTANRNDSMVQIEQTASTTLGQAARDIRSAHTITIPTGATAANSVVLQVNQPSGSFANVKWVYDPTKLTLTRYVQNTSGTYVATGPPASNVSNGSNGVFTYYNYSGANITSTTTAIITSCATRINVQVDVSSKIANVPAFQVSDDVALSDQLESIIQNGTPC